MLAHVFQRRSVLWLLGIGIASLAGALVVPISDLGRVTPASMTRQWLFLFLICWTGLSGWALLYALARHLLLREPSEQALRYAAFAHAPLLLCLGLITAVYHNDAFNHAYSVNSPYGQLVLQPLAKGYLILLPALAQALLWARARRKALLGAFPILMITLVALALRLWNLNWGLPAQFHPDEYQYTGRAFLMVVSGDPNPHYFKNPNLMIYIVHGLYLLLWERVQDFHALASVLGMSIEDPRGDYLRILAARSASALAGTLTIPAVYLAARELMGRKAALMGALFLAVAFLHVRDSHYATNDILSVFFLSLSFLFSTRVYTRGRPADYMLAGIFGGLGTSAKYNVGFFGVALIIAHLLRLANNRSAWASIRPNLPLLLGGAAALVSFFAGTPYALLDFRSFLADFLAQYDLGSNPWSGQHAVPAPLLYGTNLVQGFGLIPLFLAAIGIFLAWKRERLELALLLVTPALYLLFMFPQQLFFARFAISLLPYLSILAGYAASRLLSLGPKSSRQGMAFLLLVVAVAQPLAMSAQADLLLGKQDTRALAAEWIEHNTPPDTSVAVEHFAHLDGDKLHWDRWNSYQGRNAFVFWPDDAQERNQGLSGDYQYVVVSSFAYGPWQLNSPGPSAPPVQYEALEKRGQLVARFGPARENQDVPYSQDDMYTPFWQLFNRERPGPTVAIYSMR